MSVVSLHKKLSEPGLTGSDYIAFVAVASKLQSALASNTTSNLWGSFTALVFSAGEGGTREERLSVAERVFTEAKAAMQSQVVKAALASAGYGDFDTMIVTDDGKEGVTKPSGKMLAERYGTKFKLGRVLERAVTTLTQYYNNIRSAIELDVPDWNKLTVGQIGKEARKIREQHDPALVAARQLDEAAVFRGDFYAAIHKKFSANESDIRLLNLVTALLDKWEYVAVDDKVSIEDFLSDHAVLADANSAKAKQIIGKPQSEQESDSDEGAEPELVRLDPGTVSEPVAASA